MRYAGWVHARREVLGWGQEDEYFDTVSGTWASVTRGPEGLRVRMYVPGERAELTYDSGEGVVRVRELDEGFAERWAADVRARTMKADWLTSGVPAGVTVTRVRDGELDRYETSTSASAQAGTACADGSAAGTAVPRIEGVTWADARTGLVRRSDATIGGMRVTCQYMYGGPGVRDVFEMGVPRDTLVVDERPWQ
jgi:hypothetical protein